MAPRSWIKLYPRAWRADPRLGMCSLAARGLWLELLIIMSRMDGRLVVDGVAPSTDRLANIVCGPAAEIPPLLEELLSAGIIHRDRHGVIYCREMQAESVTRALRRAAVAESVLRRDGQISWTLVRAAVLKRDGNRCTYCGATDGPFEVDHVKARALGGTNHPSNLTVACRTCNRSKSDQPLAEWRR